MIEPSVLEEAVKHAVDIAVQKHKERFIQQAVQDYESSLRAEIARTADAYTAIIRSDFHEDRITVEIRIVSKRG
jgi:hypothetical protein